MDATGLHVAPLETEDYVLTAISSPDGTAKILVAGEFIQFESPCENYADAKQQVIRSAELLDTITPTPLERAEWFVYAHLPALLAQHGAPPSIRLTDYETEGDLHFLKPEEATESTLLIHRIRNHEVQAMLKDEGGPVVEFRRLRMADYFEWLARNGLPNEPMNRARFISE